MNRAVASIAQRDQILFCIVARLAAKLFVVNFQVRNRAAQLTPPALATRHLLPQPLVRHCVQPQRLLMSELMKPSRSDLQEMLASALRAGT